MPGPKCEKCLAASRKRNICNRENGTTVLLNTGMNLAHLRRKLIAAARANPPGDQVPYAFEKRVLARLRAAQVEDAWALWGRALWRSALACLVVAIGLSVWSYQSNPEVDIDLESAMVSAADQEVDSW